MATAKYTLNFYINSATTDSPSKTQPSDVPDGFPASANRNWIKAFAWEWVIVDDTLGAYKVGNRTMIFPCSAPGVSVPSSLAGQEFDVCIYDLNVDPVSSTCKNGIIQMIVQFVFTYPSSANWSGQFFSSGINAVGNYTSPTCNAPDQESTTQGPKSATTVTIATLAQQSPQMSGTPVLLNSSAGRQTVGAWGWALTFQDAPPPQCNGDVTLWLSVGPNNTTPEFFFKDPEMEVGLGGGN